MRQPIAAILVAAAIAAPPAIAQPREMQVSLPDEPGFVIANRQRSARQILVEMVPVGQSVTRYDRMISLQTFPGLGRVPVPDYLLEFTRRYRAACPKATANAAPMGRAPGMRIDCPRHPRTGKAETVFVRAIPAGPDMALVHVMMTYFPMPRDAGWARDYLGRVALR